MIIDFKFNTRTRVPPTGIVLIGAGITIGNGAGSQTLATGVSIIAVGIDRVMIDFITTGLTVGLGGYAAASTLESKFYLTGCEL